MHDQLVGYLLNALEEDELRRVEQLLAVDKQVRMQLVLLRHALLPLENDAQDEGLPRGLAARTCEYIRNSRKA